MDLYDFDTVSGSEDGAWMTVYQPNNIDIITHEDGEPQRIKFMGQDAPAFRDFQKKQQQRRMSSKAKYNVEKETMDLLVFATLDWDLSTKGEKIKYTKEAVKDLYERFPFIFIQGVSFVGDRSNFIPAGTTAS